MALTASQLIQNIEASGLLEREDLSAARAQANESDLDGQALAVQLVQAKKLTPYQAKQLLAGNTRGFFLEKYKILEPIGRGGMGLVFKAEHTLLARLAAIKVLPRRAASDRESVARFRREARATAQLEHENIVRVYDVSQQGEAHFIAMEFVQGQSLSKTIKNRGKLTVRESVSIIYQVAQGLEHAFSRGIIHRDIKPSNILITPEGKAKILDMGLARVFGLTAEEGASQLSLTMSGTVVGTVDYVAPEQADDSHKADVRSDIYSLGCTLYECVTGRVPFPGGTMMQKLMKHYRSNPTEIRELAPDVPDGLVTVIKRMMAKRAQHRFQRPSEVAVALLAFLTADSPGQLPGSSLLVPIALKPMNSTDVQTPSTPMDLRRDGDVPPDASRPTMPTIPLGTPGRTKQPAAKVAQANESVTDKVSASRSGDTRSNRAASTDTRKEVIASKPALESTATTEKQRALPASASGTEFDVVTMDSVSTIQEKTRKKPARRSQSAEVNEILDAIALAASESPPSAAADPVPNFTWSRTHSTAVALIAVIVFVASGIYYWFNSRPGTLIVQCPEPYSSEISTAVANKTGRILLDGKPMTLSKFTRQEFRISPGYHILHVDLPELNKISERVAISSGTETLIKLTPTEDKMRVWGLQELTKRVDDKAGSDTGDSDVVTLLNDLNAFAARHRGSEVAQALSLRSRFLWPADRLQAPSGQEPIVKLIDTPNSHIKSIKVVATLEAGQATSSVVNCLAISADGAYLACGRADGKVQVWDVGSATQFRTLGQHRKGVQAALVAGGNSVTSVSNEQIIVWDVRDGTQRASIDIANRELVAAAQSADGQTLACAFQDGQVSFYDALSGREKAKLTFTGSAESLAVSSIGTVLAFGGKEKVEIREIATGGKMGNVNSPGTIAMSFSQDDQWLSLVGKSGTAKVWQAGASRFSVQAEPNCTLLAFSPSVQSVAAVFDGRTVRLLRTTTGEILGAFELDASAGSIRHLVFAPDTRHIATADSNGIVRVLRLDGAP